MDKTSRLQYNLTVLKRKDPRISKILDTTSQAVVYEYEENSWKRMNVEGTMFLYARDTAPYYGLFVMNRLSTNNYNLAITDDIKDAKTESSFMMFKLASGSIHGLWVFEENDRDRIMRTVNEIRTNPYYPPTETLLRQVATAPSLGLRNHASDKTNNDTSTTDNSIEGGIVAMFEKARKQSKNQHKISEAATNDTTIVYSPTTSKNIQNTGRESGARNVTTDELSSVLLQMQTIDAQGTNSQPMFLPEAGNFYASSTAPLTVTSTPLLDEAHNVPFQGSNGADPTPLSTIPFGGSPASFMPFPPLPMLPQGMIPGMPFGSPFMALNLPAIPGAPFWGSVLSHDMAQFQSSMQGQPLSMTEFRDEFVSMLQESISFYNRHPDEERDGQVTTYKTIADTLQSSPRAVGQALRHNPFAPYVPCHRVLTSSYFIGGFCGEYGSGEQINKKKQMLKAEGINFEGDYLNINSVQSQVWRLSVNVAKN